MAVQKQDGLHTDAAPGAVDLTGHEYRFVSRNATGQLVKTGAGARADGICSEGKPAGKWSSYNTEGNPILRVIAGGAINPNARVQSDANSAAVAGLNNSFGVYRGTAAAVAGQVISIHPERFDADGA